MPCFVYYLSVNEENVTKSQNLNSQITKPAAACHHRNVLCIWHAGGLCDAMRYLI